MYLRLSYLMAIWRGPNLGIGSSFGSHSMLNMNQGMLFCLKFLCVTLLCLFRDPGDVVFILLSGLSPYLMGVCVDPLLTSCTKPSQMKSRYLGIWIKPSSVRIGRLFTPMVDVRVVSHRREVLWEFFYDHSVWFLPRATNCLTHMYWKGGKMSKERPCDVVQHVHTNSLPHPRKNYLHGGG